MRKRTLQIALALAAALGTMTLVWAAPFGGADIPTLFTNKNSVINTRHNMTWRDASGAKLFGFTSTMDDERNNYGEVCVYCHTPHGADASAAVPLWNRLLPASTTYTTYNELNTSSLTQTVSQPGAASLTCLSCHDGQQAIDAIINMPGSGGYSTAPSTGIFDSRLSSWPGSSGVHFGLDATRYDSIDGETYFPSPTGYYLSCLGCHSAWPSMAPLAADFKPAAIGTDLRNDHPVGVTYPTATGAGTDWNTPASRLVNGQTVKFFDDTPNGRLDKNEIRLFGSANGPSVECASCHDPHGVPSGGAGSTFFPTFMRKSNAGSALCMTCHAK